ncbi:polysaccharide deacetylase family protein [Mycetocola spongiae]|uniref:polysaccharide deacetylase family protein n=1 Tax=Mycetocola spongiae TaxID=2859226 RepID=UPI001CF4ABED|nr:polysaccharide deacetylase family protein [Mycetocola spongiae]UCR89586.1 polysaccharide deacetylase family protein [Mycetocola spongiae]
MRIWRASLAIVMGGILALGTACATRPAEAGPSGAATPPVPSASAEGTPPAEPSSDPEPSAPPAPVLPERVALPRGPITGLPGQGNFLAWTVDDGSDAETVARYVDFAERTGTRLTFFINGSYPGWAAQAERLRPMIASGQVQIGNHTWSHQALTKLSDRGIIDELTRNETYIQDTFGVSAKPYYRPPFGYRSAHTDAVAASIGYTVPVLWYGSLSDSGLITTEQVVQFADQWFLPQHIVIGHANYTPVTEVFGELSGIISQRGLQTVTLNDVFISP